VNQAKQYKYKYKQTMTLSQGRLSGMIANPLAPRVTTTATATATPTVTFSAEGRSPSYSHGHGSANTAAVGLTGTANANAIAGMIPHSHNHSTALPVLLPSPLPALAPAPYTQPPPPQPSPTPTQQPQVQQVQQVQRPFSSTTTPPCYKAPAGYRDYAEVDVRSLDSPQTKQDQLQHFFNEENPQVLIRRCKSLDYVFPQKLHMLLTASEQDPELERYEDCSCQIGCVCAWVLAAF